MFFKFFIVIVCLTGELLVSVVLVGVTYFLRMFFFFFQQASKQASNSWLASLLACLLLDCLLTPLLA